MKYFAPEYSELLIGAQDVITTSNQTGPGSNVDTPEEEV